MAFQQPTRQTASRVARHAPVQDRNLAVLPIASSAEREAEGSQTWVLFSPPTDVATTSSYLTESEHSLQAPGRSRLSDLASLHTIARSEEVSIAQPLSSVLSAVDGQDGDDDAELDSLDSHLPDFRSVPGLDLSQLGRQQAIPVFPSHDGLGSFRLDRPVIGSDAQEEMFKFEEYNPRKIRRPLDSFDHTPISLEEVFPQQEEKRQRIEAWRLENSRAFVEELQRETRRRQKSLESLHRSKASFDAGAEADNLNWHDEDAMPTSGDQESLVVRMTRSIVRDVFGIDDEMLSILLGEKLPTDYEGLLSTTPRASQRDAQQTLAPSDQSSWQIRILARVSRELGLLVNHLAPHPGAFITYSVMQRMDLPYAGLPVIPESCDTCMEEPTTNLDEKGQASVPEFQPTVTSHHQPLDTHSRKPSGDKQTEGTDVAGGHFSKEEWEKSLDIKLVFRYLISRFTSRSADTSPQICAIKHTTPTPQENAAKIARVRQHHPLTTRSRPAERRCLRAVTPTSPVALRHHSSCASQSTKRSARRSSCSSRHYWDIGGSLGTGSVMASNGPMGSWGEV
ncbi:hypothetical protein E4U36_005805 [Claviceps purpurea]|nr:hypothetical protein E4U36_005805 [Claviceps purpurea]